MAIAFNFYNSFPFFFFPEERLKMAKHDGWLLNRDSTLTANRCVLFGLLTHLNILKTFETTFKNWGISYEISVFWFNFKKQTRHLLNDPHSYRATEA